MSFVHFKNGAHGLAEENGCVKWKLNNSRRAHPERFKARGACRLLIEGCWMPKGNGLLYRHLLGATATELLVLFQPQMLREKI